jgi:single-strand selective monofunctional uracil DNA glycosylase
MASRIASKPLGPNPRLTGGLVTRKDRRGLVNRGDLQRLAVRFVQFGHPCDEPSPPRLYGQPDLAFPPGFHIVSKMIKAVASQPSPGSQHLIAAAQALSAQAGRLRFAGPVTHIYNPLAYAWRAHEDYLRRYGPGRKRVVFLGMNPGPFGMTQTGVPFGEVAAVRDWLHIHTPVSPPANAHPKRPVQGFDCPRSEVSGRRLWGLFAERFGTPEAFFAGHFVLNYCPLVFCEAGGKNRTPDKLPPEEQVRLFAVCDEHLRRVVEILAPEWLIGVGGFAAARGEGLAAGGKVKLGRILHPSPASPAANRGWGPAVTRQLLELGVWR